MRNKTSFCFILLLLLSMPGRSQSMWDKAHLQEVKQDISQSYYAAAFDALIVEADRLLSVEPVSVIQKEKTPKSGSKHDYMSLARYAWPDSTKANGLPYIMLDGLTNPEIDKLDRNRLGETASRVTTLTLAWYFSGQEKYAAKAAELIRVWFLDKKTKMNPNLRFSQVFPGHHNDEGRNYGLIDSYSFVDMLEAVALLEHSKSFPKREQKQLKQWFTQFTHWMLTSPQGQQESSVANNHSVAYDAQIIAFSLYAGDVETATRFIKAFPTKRAFPQIEPDGRQPHELRRTRAFHYSYYNLTHFIDIYLMAKKLGLDIDRTVSEDGRNFYKAMDFLAPFVGNRAAWEYEEIGDWGEVEQNLCKDYYRTALYLDPARKDYLRLYREHRIWNPQDIFNLLYVKATEVDHAYAFAAGQLRLAVKEADKARKTPENVDKRRVMPRSIHKDGSLAMIHPHDWCSGFFPGSLWQMYAYTNDTYWRETAISWTWPIEEAKWHKGTHDLGFMINDSFGKAYELTGERSYRDVVLQAARTLITRYSSKVKSIRSWDHNRDKWDYPVIIDNMMNLEMLFRATQLTGDSIFWDVAVNHANTTLKNHFRSDYSSYHVVDYNPETGEVQQKCTHQGNSDDSFWSRGQGWGLYGYAMCYRFTKDPAYLKQSEGIADFFINLPNLPADGVPYWDMKMPEIANATPDNVNASVPRDASAAALTASGLYELSAYVAPEKGKVYRAHADKIVDSLRKHYQAEPGSHYGFLLLHSTGHHPGGSEIDVPINYADYYYLEALARKAMWDNK